MSRGSVSGVTAGGDAYHEINEELLLNHVVIASEARDPYPTENVYWDPSLRSACSNSGKSTQRADLKIENTAPCGSAITDMRPTPAMLTGGRCNFAPISLALLAVASTSST